MMSERETHVQKPHPPAFQTVFFQKQPIRRKSLEEGGAKAACFTLDELRVPHKKNYSELLIMQSSPQGCLYLPRLI